MTLAELDAIEARSLQARVLVQRHTLITDEFMQTVEAVVHSDTPALVAEVRRLQAITQVGPRLSGRGYP